MNPAKLYRHGQPLPPLCRPQPANPGKSTDEERSDGHMCGILRRYGKRQSVADRTTACGWIRATYIDAIEYTNIPDTTRGIPLCLGVFFFALCMTFSIATWPSADMKDMESFVVFAVFSSISFVFGIAALIFGVGLELFGVTDAPVIFDRRHRKVYLPFLQNEPGWNWKSISKPGRPCAVEYDWDLIDAEHHSAIVTSGKVVSQQNMLHFQVRKSASDPTIIDSFMIGQFEVYTELSVHAVWEHIRRFMEESGPHLPPGEAVVVPHPPRNLGHAIHRAFFGRMSFWQWVQDGPWFALLFFVFSPLFVPMCFLQGIGNWLAYKTAIPIPWPQEVLQALGPPIAGESAGGHLEK